MGVGVGVGVLACGAWVVSCLVSRLGCYHPYSSNAISLYIKFIHESLRHGVAWRGVAWRGVVVWWRGVAWRGLALPILKAFLCDPQARRRVWSAGFIACNLLFVSRTVSMLRETREATHAHSISSPAGTFTRFVLVHCMPSLGVHIASGMTDFELAMVGM